MLYAAICFIHTKACRGTYNVSAIGNSENKSDSRTIKLETLIRLIVLGKENFTKVFYLHHSQNVYNGTKFMFYTDILVFYVVL